MAIAPVFAAAATPASGTDPTISYSGVAGRLYIVCGGIAVLPAVDNAVSDNGGNTWTRIESCPPSGTTGRRCFMWYTVATSSFTTVTIDHDNVQLCGASLVEVTGFDTTTPLDTHASASRASSTTPAAVTATPTNSGSLEICIIQANTNNHQTAVTVPSGYTDLTGYPTGGPKIVYKIGATAGVADGASFTLTASQGSGLVTAFFNAGSTPIAMSDTQTQSETSMAIQVNTAITDSGTVSESMAISVPIAMSDTQTQTESMAVSNLVTVSDSAALTDSMVVVPNVPVSDSGAVTDTLAVTVNVALTDSGTVTESLAAGVPITMTDSGTITESMGIVATSIVYTIVPPIDSTIVGTPLVSRKNPPNSALMGPPSQVIQDAITAGVVKVYRRIEIYESDAVTPFDIDDWDGRLNTGNITVDGSRDERRMIDVTLNNGDFALNLDPYKGLYYDKVLKSFWGVDYYDIDNALQHWEIQTGEFMIDAIDEDRFPHLTHVVGRDYTKLCLGSKITQSESFSSTYPIEEIIRGLAANAGVKKFRLPKTGLYFTDDTVFDIGTDRWTIMKKVTDSVGYEIYFTADGFLTIRPYQDPVLSPLTYVFQPGANTGTLVSYKKNSNDSLIKNHTIVIGATTTDDLGISTTAYGESVNDDPGSPTRRYNVDGSNHLGDRSDVFKSDYITSPADAQALADARLRLMSLEEFSIDFSALVIPWLEANDIIAVIDPQESVYTPIRFLFSNFTLPFSLGPMTGNAKRVTIVGTVSNVGALA